MRTKVLFIFLIVNSFIFAQELQWKAGLNYFFDNTEFASSTLTQDQTMNGVHFSPEIGISWDSVHAFFGGVNALKISGSKGFVDKVDFTAYYQYKSNNVDFKAGNFPRADLLSNYSDFFFQDSVINFRPILQGVFLQKGNKNAYYNIWLDWVSHQTDIDRESFYAGASAHKSSGMFFVDFQSYMFHYANTLASHPLYSVCDNALAHLSVGSAYSNKQGIDTLLFAVGVLGGYERDRGMGDDAYMPVGLVLRLNFQYRGFGTNNTLYVGDPRMSLYNKYGGDFYWSNPFLRSKSYLESKFYVNVFNREWINGKVGMNLHFSEKQIFFEQTFSLNVSLNSLTKSHNKNTSVLKSKTN
ncbi:MAG: hypothetical protein WCG93_06720 [Paludibacter sp.]